MNKAKLFKELDKLEALQESHEADQERSTNRNRSSAPDYQAIERWCNKAKKIREDINKFKYKIENS